LDLNVDQHVLGIQRSERMSEAVMVVNLVCAVLAIMSLSVISVDALECVTCQMQGPMVTGDCKVKKPCPAEATRCMNMSFTMKMDVMGSERAMDAWQVGCGNDMQCGMSSADMCKMNEEVMTQSGMEVEVSNCKIECSGEGGTPGGGAAGGGGGGAGAGGKVTCPTCVKAGPTITPCVDSECPTGVTQCLHMTWKMGFMGMHFDSWQKMCAMPMQCAMSGEDTCKSSEQFLTNMGLTNITLSNCASTCTPGTPVVGGGDGDVATAAPVVTDSGDKGDGAGTGGSGGGLQCDTCTIMPGMPGNCEKKTCEMGADRCMAISYNIEVAGQKMTGTQKSCANSAMQCSMSGDQMCQMIQKHMPPDAGMKVSGCKIECTNPAGAGGDKPVTVSPGVDGGDKDGDDKSGGDGDKDGKDKGGSTESGDGGDKTPTDGGDKSSTSGGDKSPTDGGDKTPTSGGDKTPTDGGDKATTDGGDKTTETGGDKKPDGDDDDNKLPAVTDSGTSDKNDEKKPVGKDKNTGDSESEGNHVMTNLSLLGTILSLSLLFILN